MNRLSTYCFLFIAVIVAMTASCSVDNKTIPDPGGNIPVDTSGNAGAFYLNVSGDTTYRMTIFGTGSLRNDSFIVLGADTTSKDQILFGTFKSEPGVYLTEQTPPSSTGAVFLYRKKEPTVYKNYLMVHGNITISSVDTTARLVRGSVNVNNIDVSGVDRFYTITGNFAIRY